MTEEFNPRLDVLPPPQLRLWHELETVPPEAIKKRLVQAAIAVDTDRIPVIAAPTRAVGSDPSFPQ